MNKDSDAMISKITETAKIALGFSLIFSTVSSIMLFVILITPDGSSTIGGFSTTTSSVIFTGSFGGATYCPDSVPPVPWLALSSDVTYLIVKLQVSSLPLTCPLVVLHRI